MIRHFLRAYPTLLRVGLAEMIAYRTEFFIWILTTNMPLVMMGLWTAVAAEGPVAGFDQRDFVAYYLGTLIVRLITSTWMVWELTMDIRQGRLATRLLRPLHPLFAYSAQHLAAVPLRALIVSPLIVVLWFVADHQMAMGDPVRIGILIASVVGAWLILFFMMVIIGCLALFVESGLAVFEVWLGFHYILSGYLIPLDLLPHWISAVARVLPFHYTLGFPVEILVGLRDPKEALATLAAQWIYVLAFFLGALFIWRAGMKKFVAFGG